MTLTEEHALEAVKQLLAKKRADIVSEWSSEKLSLVRERLWVEHQAIERIEESISEEFRSIIRRGAGPD